MPNGFLTTENILDTDTQLLGYPEQVYYSGASGVNVDNTNLIISLTGEVGKVYNGVNPIVVNNDENLISANSAPIGVQEPLYFVQDDDEAVVIGFSGEYVTPSDIAGKLDTSSFEGWQQGQYTNDLTAINEKINEVSSNIPSIEGLATEQLVEETSATIVSQIPSTAGLASETYVQEQTSGKASKSDLETVSGDIVDLIPDVSNFYTKDETSGAAQLAEAFSQIGPGGDEEVNELVHSNSGVWNEVSSKLDESTFQEASGLFLTAIPQEYITETDLPNFISAKLDTSSFADVSGSFLTAHQDLSDYATTATTNALSEQIEELSGTISAKHTLSAGEGISFYEDDVNNITRIDCTVTGGAGDEEVNQAVHTNSATWNTVTDKLDTTAQVISSYTTATIEGNPLIISLNDTPINAYRAVSAQEAGIADKARYDFDGNNLASDHNSLTSLKDFVQSNSANYIPYSASGVELPNSNFKIDTSGQAYKLSITTTSAEQPLNDNFFGSPFYTLNYPFGKGKHYIVNVPSDRVKFTVNESTYGSTMICSGVVQDGVCDFVYPSSGITGYKRLYTYTDNYANTATLTTSNCKLYYFTTTSGTDEYALKSDLEQVSADITATIPSTAGLASESYVQTNSAVLTAMIDGKQDTLTFGYDEQDRISAINSSALAGGGDVPEDVMVETNLEYNAVGEISGYEGSAIAQYGAEKQWLVHDRNTRSFV